MSEPVHNTHEDALVAELASAANEVFGDLETASRWLDTALSELNDLSPRETVIRAGQTGLEQARDVLLRIEYGVYS